MIVYHGSNKKIDNINFNICHLGWHAGTLCQAIDCACPEYKRNKFDWEHTYVYICDIEPINKNTLLIPDLFIYDSDFNENIIRVIKAHCKQQFPSKKTLYNKLDECTTTEDIRNLLVKYNIKYIKYNNEYETKGDSYCILYDDIEIKEFSFYDLLTNYVVLNN